MIHTKICHFFNVLVNKKGGGEFVKKVWYWRVKGSKKCHSAILH